MSLFEVDLGSGRAWTRVGDCYSVTKKPRGLDLGSVAEVPFAAMEAIPQGGAYDPSFTMKAPKAITSGTYFERNDLLVAKITPSFENGKQAFARALPASFGYATTEVIPLRPRKPGHDPRLLFFYLLHPDVRHHVAARMEGSTGRQRVPESVLLDLPIPEIDRDGQSAIADALETVHAAATAELNAEQNATALKRAAMDALFSRGLHNEARKETEIGPLPESWRLFNLRDVREWLQYGTSVHCTLEPRNYPVLRIPNVGSGRVNPTDLKYCDLSATEASKYILRAGDILFIRTNGVLERLGSCAVYQGEPRDALFASYLIRARLKAGVVDPRYLAYFYGSPIGTSLVAGRATPAADGKYNLNTGTIDSLPLPMPPTLDEQQEMVAVLEALDQKIDLHQERQRVLKQIFKSLLHKLITGEIAVSDLDLSALSSAPTQHEEVAT